MEITLFSSDFLATLLRFLICVAVNWFIVELLYYRKSHRRDFYFTFLLMTVAIFFLVYFMMGMERGKATMGVGLGLFGIFSIMRYRTDTMPVREMTYLFVIICMAVVHAMADNYYELAAVDVVVTAAIWLCELKLKIHPTKLIQYDRIALIKPEKREELIADLEERLGVKVIDVQVGAIDFLRDMAMLRISYETEGKGSNEVDNMLKIKTTQYADV
jgi:hypothetical protein